MASTATPTTTSTGISVGFIGYGNMASAIANGLLDSKICSPSDLHACDKYPPSLEKARALGMFASAETAEILEKAKDAIVLAVKPNQIAEVCALIAALSSSASTSSACVISIAAGISLTELESQLPNHRVIRVMPNTPLMVGCGATGFALGTLATPADRVIVETLFGSVGIAHEMSEVLLNAVTGLSGSGPAYVFQFIEALSDGGVRAGLPRNVATELAAQTVKGAAEMVLSTKKHPGELKDMVTSAGGTTIAGVERLEQGGLRATTIGAVVAATRRSMQLGGISEEDINTKYNMK